MRGGSWRLLQSDKAPSSGSRVPTHEAIVHTLQYFTNRRPISYSLASVVGFGCRRGLYGCRQREGSLVKVACACAAVSAPTPTYSNV